MKVEFSIVDKEAYAYLYLDKLNNQTNDKIENIISSKLEDYILIGKVTFQLNWSRDTTLKEILKESINSHYKKFLKCLKGSPYKPIIVNEDLKLEEENGFITTKVIYCLPPRMSLREFIAFCESEETRMQNNFNAEIERLRKLENDLEILNKN